jgi:hypothetical protein
MFQTEVKESMETAPIVVDGIMYMTTSFNHVYALDAHGPQFWHYKHKMGAITTFCCGPNNRGVAIEGGRLFMGTLDAKLVALDARTGDVLWQTQIADPEKGYSETMAPTVVDGKVLIGTNGGEYGIRGFVKAYGASDGKLLWTFYTIPEKGHEGVWAENDLTGRNMKRNIAPRSRPGARQLLLPDAGRRRVDEPRRGPEDAHHLLRGGQPLARPVRRRAARRQPLHRLDGGGGPGHGPVQVALAVHRARRVGPGRREPADPGGREGRGGRMVPGRDPRRQDRPRVRARTRHRQADPLLGAMIPQENMWVLPTATGARMLPGANGGVEWSPMAFQPEAPAGLCAEPAPAHDLPRGGSQVPGGKLWLGGAFKVIEGEKQWGRLAAVNIDTGKMAWKFDTEQPLIGGALATGGDLVFYGEGNG